MVTDDEEEPTVAVVAIEDAVVSAPAVAAIEDAVVSSSAPGSSASEFAVGSDVDSDEDFPWHELCVPCEGVPMAFQNCMGGPSAK